jgi:hypothetical protein
MEDHFGDFAFLIEPVSDKFEPSLRSRKSDIENSRLETFAEK